MTERFEAGRLSWRRAALALVAFAAMSAPQVAAADDSSLGAIAGPVAMRRLTEEQYKQIIADVFGPTIKLGGRFEPDLRDSGLLAVGASEVSVTASGFEQYDAMARSAATQVTDEQHRASMVPCKPANPAAPDDSCARTFLSRAGRLLYRRPLTDVELNAVVAGAAAAASKDKDFYSGLGLALASMLEAPQFLFRQEVAEPDPDHAGQSRLDAWSKATRLSFFLWDTVPDAQLLDAAEKGELNSDRGTAKQVDRMMASPRLEAGVRAFFTDMLGFDTFETLAKDPTLYPKFGPRVAADMQEQTLRTVVDHLLVQKGDYRDLFTTRKTFLTPALASIYHVTIAPPDGMWNSFVPYEYPADAEQAGILTQASFVALHSHPGRSSPTIRGKAMRQVLLCQKVPDPPGNVNFRVVQDTTNPQYRTARERVTAHRTEPTCAGCHKLIDPIGLAMENFDTVGGYRMTENGAPIDASGELDGIKFNDAVGLGKAVHDHPAVPACIVNRVYSYAVGHKPGRTEAEWLKDAVEKQFVADGYKFPELLREIATSEAFYRVTPPQTGAIDSSPVKFASGTNPAQENLK
jgi:hypothetical protein